jgi:hypothetical protein
MTKSLSTSSFINAFHPDYIKTYHPKFTKEFWSVEANKVERETQPKVKRKRTPKKMTTKYITGTPTLRARTVDQVRAELEAKKRAWLDPKTFTVYAKAGVGNVKPRGKKK